MFALISNIIRNTLRDFMWKCSRKFGSKNVEFLTSRMFASSMNPCLSKFGALRGLCPQIMRQCKNFRVALLPLLNKTYTREADV